MKSPRRGRFSFKEHRELKSMLSAGATPEEAAAKFKTSPEMILQKPSELGVRVDGVSRSRKR